MIFENTSVYNFENAFRGMRNPLDSWNKSDSYKSSDVDYIIGKKDLKLAQKLIKGGVEHSKFMRQIFVSVDITAPLYWWSEFDTYKVGTVANSCSTMHKLYAYPFSINMFEVDNEYPRFIWDKLIDYLESVRQEYNRTKDIKLFRIMKQLLPSSFNQKRTITLSYAVLRNMYLQRKNHKLTEWSIDFVNWVKSLPYSEELICYKDVN